MGVEVPESTEWNILVGWGVVLDTLSIGVVNGRYELIFNYKDLSGGKIC